MRLAYACGRRLARITLNEYTNEHNRPAGQWWSWDWQKRVIALVLASMLCNKMCSPSSAWWRWVVRELDERRASLLIYPGFSSSRPRKQRGKKRPLLTTSSQKKDKADNPFHKPLLRQYQRILGRQGIIQCACSTSNSEFTLRACKHRAQVQIPCYCTVLCCAMHGSSKVTAWREVFCTGDPERWHQSCFAMRNRHPFIPGAASFPCSVVVSLHLLVSSY